MNKHQFTFAWKISRWLSPYQCFTGNRFRNLQALLCQLVKNLGRIHLVTSYSGPSHVYIRSSKYNGTTVVSHITDIHRIICSSNELKNKSVDDYGWRWPWFYSRICFKCVVFLSFIQNVEAWHDQFLHTRLDTPLLTVLNIFGRLWATSWQEFNLALNSKKNRNHQHSWGLSKDELFQKEKIVFDEAITSIARDHWKDAKFDANPVNAYPLLCGEDDLLYDDCETTKEFLNCPIRDIHKHSTIKKDYESMHRHLDRHLNEIVFTKCDDRTCCGEWR